MLVMTGLVGLLVMVYVVALRWLLQGHDDDGGGSGPEGLQPIPIRPVSDLDEELRRILDDARLRDAPQRPRVHPQNRRPGTA